MPSFFFSFISQKIQNDSRKKYMALDEGEWNSLGYARRALGGANHANSSMVERQTYPSLETFVRSGQSFAFFSSPIIERVKILKGGLKDESLV